MYQGKTAVYHQISRWKMTLELRAPSLISKAFQIPTVVYAERAMQLESLIREKSIRTTKSCL